MTKHALLAAAGTLMVATATNAALIRPAGMTNLYDCNFDGDGAAAGTVDSGSSATDWFNNNVQSLKTAGWTVNEGADRDNGLYVVTNDIGGHLAIKDVVASANVVVPSDATPQATLGFGDRSRGFIELDAATEGTQSQSGVISLRDGATELARLNITNNTSGSFVYGGGSTSFTDSTWFRLYRTHQIAWTVNEDGTGGKLSWFFDANGTDQQVIDVPFLANGVPDRLVLRVGFDSNTADKRLLLDNLTVAAAVPEPASLGALVLAGGLLMARRRRD